MERKTNSTKKKPHKNFILKLFSYVRNKNEWKCYTLRMFMEKFTQIMCSKALPEAL
jgi:hypothetical protein